MRRIVRYWGYVLLALLVAAWWSTKVGPIPLIVLSIIVSAYCLFQAPVWCGAVNRNDSLCRRNAYGLLLGCGFRQHRWQKLKMTVAPRTWRRLGRGLWASPATGLATISATVGIVSTLAALVSSLFIGNGSPS